MKSLVASLHCASLDDSRPLEPDLEQLIEATAAQLQAGEALDFEQLIAAHPEYADQLRELLPAVELLVRMGNQTLGPAAATNRHTPPPHQQLGDFRLIRELGRGGMGTVYEAEQLAMGRHVALKVLPFAALADDKSLQRFRNEVRAAAALDHPHIVSVYSVGEERGVHFYAMQLIRGRTLADMIHELRTTRQGTVSVAGSDSDRAPTMDSSFAQPPSTMCDEQARLSTAADSRHVREYYRTAARLGIEAAEALQHAHDQGVLHRDIKLGNLMLDRDGKLYVTDFGLARIEADAGLTMTGDIIGTLRYMAPEQALAKRVVIDHRADVYSLGATLYELLTLEPAFGETDRSELLKQIAFEEPRPPRKLDRRIPAELETIVLKAMAKMPDERYQTAQRLADDLRAFLDNRPIMAKPPTVWQHAAKWSRRHVGVVWTALAALLAVLTVSLASTVLVAKWYGEANAQRRTAEREFQGAEEARKQEASALRAERDYTTAIIALISENLGRDVTQPVADFRENSAIPAKILDLYQRALAARQKLSDDNPKSIDYLMDVAATRTSFGALLALHGDKEAASNEMLTVLQMISSLAVAENTEFEKVVYRDYQRSLECAVTACAVLRMAGRTEAAVPYSRPLGMVVGEDGLLYVSSRVLDSVLRISLADGKLVDELRVPNAVLSPHGLAFGPDKRLYVSSEFQGRIVRFDGISGKFLGDFVPHVRHPVGLTFGPEGDLYVACHESNEIRRYDGSSGDLVAVWKADAGGRLNAPTGLAFAPNGDLFVACQRSDRVERYAAPSGEFRGTFATGGGLKGPIYLAFGPDGDLYVAGRDSDAVHRYDGRSGRFVKIVLGLPKLPGPEGLVFSSSGNLYVNTVAEPALLQIDSETGASSQVLR